MYSISKEYHFSAAHQLEGHPKCGRLHGHNYVVEVVLYAEALGANGMIMDYGELDDFVKPVIDAMDHRYLVSKDNLDKGNPHAKIAVESQQACMTGSQHSTAEELAQSIHGWLAVAMLPKFQVNGIAIIVHETPKSTARYYADIAED